MQQGIILKQITFNRQGQGTMKICYPCVTQSSQWRCWTLWARLAVEHFMEPILGLDGDQDVIECVSGLLNPSAGWESQRGQRELNAAQKYILLGLGSLHLISLHFNTVPAQLQIHRRVGIQGYFLTSRHSSVRGPQLSAQWAHALGIYPLLNLHTADTGGQDLMKDLWLQWLEPWICNRNVSSFWDVDRNAKRMTLLLMLLLLYNNNDHNTINYRYLLNHASLLAMDSPLAISCSASWFDEVNIP